VVFNPEMNREAHEKAQSLRSEFVVGVKGEVVIIDRGSTNGTFINNNKVEKTKLNAGDIIHLGQKSPITLIFNK
jgi:aspartyl-tRNA synthetase